MWLEQSVYGESKSEQGGREANSRKALQALEKVWSSSLRETLDGFGREGRGLCLDRLSSDINSRDLFLLHVPHPRMDVSCGSPLCPSILEPRLNNHVPRQTGRGKSKRDGVTSAGNWPKSLRSHQITHQVTSPSLWMTSGYALFLLKISA